MNYETIKGSDQANTPKLLSICMTGRDDNYMLDFRYRITTTINHIACSLKQLGRLNDVEILVTDWGSHIPMVQTLKLSPEAAEITRFIFVTSDIIRATQDGKDDFHASRTPNVAIRRASGTYILFYNADTLIPQYSLESLLRFLEGEIKLGIELEQTYFLLPRLDVPWQFLERQPGLEEWDRYFLTCSKNKPLELSPTFSFFGDAGALLMHKKMWFDLRGVDESLSGWGWNDIDLGFRVSLKHPCISLSSIGIFLYHMGHRPIGGRHIAHKNANPHIFNDHFQVNDENWGLGNFPLDMQYPVATSEIFSDTNSNPLKNTSINGDHQKNQLKIFYSELKNVSLVQNIEKSVNSFLQRNWKIREEDLYPLFLLAWYSNYRYPHKYIEFASGRTPAAGVIAMGCPSVEIYKVDTWEGTSPPYTPLDISFIYDVSPYCGYLRFIHGETRTSIQRLCDSFIGPFNFDICFVNEVTLEGDMFEYIKHLLPYMTPGGALVFVSRSKESFTYLKQQIFDIYSDFTLITCDDNKTGMILADHLMNDVKKNNLIEGVSFDTSWLTSLRIGNKLGKVKNKVFGIGFS